MKPKNSMTDNKEYPNLQNGGVSECCMPGDACSHS